MTAFSPGTVATDLGLKPNAAAKDGKLIEHEYFLQPADCGKCLVFAAEGLGQTACVSNLWLETLYHTYPAIRKGQSTFLSSL